jgi:hypothetical protein
MSRMRMRVGCWWVVIVVAACGPVIDDSGPAPAVIEANPTALEFNSLVGDPAQQLVEARNVGPDVGRVDAWVEGPFTVSPPTVVVAAGSKAQFRVGFAPVVSGTTTGLLHLGAVTVGLRGLATEAPPELLSAVSAVDFPTMLVGHSTSRVLEVTNGGTHAATIEPQTTSPFSFETARLVLAPGQAATLSVRFTPTSLGPVSGGAQVGNLTFALNGGGTDGTACPEAPSPCQVERYEPTRFACVTEPRRLALDE